MESQSEVLLRSQSASVFTLVTTLGSVVYERKILVVIDKGKNNRPNTKKKFPGGDVDNNEDLDATAGVEMLQETNLRGFKRDAILLEAHKISRNNQDEIHKDFFFLSRPIEESSPTAGEDIAYAGWEPVKDVLRQIRKNEFVPNHASACIWWLMRDEFFKTGIYEPIRATILSKPNLLLVGLKDQTLVLCFAPGCKECIRARAAGIMLPSTLFANNHRYKPAQEETASSVQGKTYFVIYCGTRFDDYVLFHAQKEGVYLLPYHQIEVSINIADIPHYAAKHFGGDYKLIGHKKTTHATIVLLHLISDPETAMANLTPECVSRKPRLMFTMYPEAWQYFNAVIPLLEAYSYAVNSRIIVNHQWKYWHDRVPEYIKNPRDTRELFSHQ